MEGIVRFYLSGTASERVEVLAAPESPLNLLQQVDSTYVFHFKGAQIDELSTLFDNSPGRVGDEQLHAEAQRALGFDAGSILLCTKDELTPERIARFQEVLEYMDIKNIPTYMTVTHNIAIEKFVAGYNPLNGTEVRNKALEEMIGLPELTTFVHVTYLTLRSLLS